MIVIVYGNRKFSYHQLYQQFFSLTANLILAGIKK